MDVRQKPHEAGALHCRFHHALLLGRETTLAAVHDATVRVDEIAKQVDVFVVDVLDIVLREDVVGCHNDLKIRSTKPEIRNKHQCSKFQRILFEV